MSEPNNLCSFLDCNDNAVGNNRLCVFHNSGGVFGNGDTYEQYQIIEKDFIDFIKVVPINIPKHLSVESPVLRDIILRCCVQIELFLKEWSLFLCSEYNTYPPFAETRLWKEYIEKRKDVTQKTKNWKIGSYFTVKESFQENATIYVRPMDKEINPFEDWVDDKKPPKWWSAYNSIKHGGQSAKKDANLENALYALSALFLLHCENEYARGYLKQFSSFSIVSRHNQVDVQFDSLKTPIDSKQYLFKYVCNYPDKKIELVTKQQIGRGTQKGWVN